ncbi:hypothetical protein D3C80_1723290 [compost metagenome]
MPSALVETKGTTGQPRCADSAAISIWICWLLAISSMFSATMQGMPSSSSCSVRYRLRSRLEASTTLISRSASPLRM